MGPQSLTLNLKAFCNLHQPMNFRDKRLRSSGDTGQLRFDRNVWVANNC